MLRDFPRLGLGVVYMLRGVFVFHPEIWKLNVVLNNNEHSGVRAFVHDSTTSIF